MKNYRVAYIHADGDVQPGIRAYWTLRSAEKDAERLTRTTKALAGGNVIDQFILSMVGGCREWFAIHKKELKILQETSKLQRALDAQPETAKKIDDFLKDPSTGVRRTRPTRREDAV